jgi:hypothetical protein
MADWTNLPNTAVGVGGLPSGTTVTALRDNPVAIAEGAAGAPRLRGIGLDLFVGSNPTGSTTFTNLDTNAWVLIGSQGGTDRRAVSNDNGSTFTEFGVIGGEAYLFNLHTGEFNRIGGAGGTIAGAPFNAVRVNPGYLFYISRGDGL